MFKKVLLMLTIGLVLVGCAASNSNNDNNNNNGDDQSAVINVYTRDSSSGTREAFESGIGLADDGLTSNALETSGNGDMASKVGNDQLGIGYVSLTTDFAASNIKPLSFEGVEASVETVLSGDYKLSRPFNMTTRAKGDFPSEAHEQVIAAFVDFVLNSTEGLLAVESAGGIVDVAAGKPWSELKTVHTVLDGDTSSVTIRTAGSTSVEKALTAALEAFNAETGIEFMMGHTGSGDGFKRVLGSEKDGANAADLGFASRPFDSEKEPQAELDKGYAAQAFALDAVVAVVSTDNDVENVTAETLEAIFSGTITSWDEVK